MLSGLGYLEKLRPREDGKILDSKSAREVLDGCSWTSSKDDHTTVILFNQNCY